MDSLIRCRVCILAFVVCILLLQSCVVCMYSMYIGVQKKIKLNIFSICIVVLISVQSRQDQKKNLVSIWCHSCGLQQSIHQHFRVNSLATSLNFYSCMPFSESSSPPKPWPMWVLFRIWVKNWAAFSDFRFFFLGFLTLSSNSYLYLQLWWCFLPKLMMIVGLLCFCCFYLIFW